MRVNRAKDSEGVTVHTMNPAPQMGPVFYASLASGTETSKGDDETKHCLVSALLDHLVAAESPPGKRCRTSDRAALPIKVVSGLLGRPHLLLGGYRGPAITFSKGGGRVWAALSGDESDVGIDVASSDEFKGAYPFHRVFHPEELHHALRLAGGDLAEAAALLWSVKEAVVKALGCAFHLVEPRHITVYASVGEGGGYTFTVGLSGKALARFPRLAGRSLRVRSLPQGKLWLSIALWNRRPAGHG